MYRITRHPSAGLIALTIVDALVLALTVGECRRQRHRKEYAGARKGG
jgi:uncharacterized membrane protein